MEHPSNIDDMEIPQINKQEATVAIIGAGPSGLACAHDLALSGIQVNIFEASDKAGGVPALSLPEYRLPSDILQRDITFIERLGVDIKTGTPVDSNLLNKLLADYDSVFLGIGLHRDKMLKIPGHDLPGVLAGGDYLRQIKLGIKIDPAKQVVVIGGGSKLTELAKADGRMVLVEPGATTAPLIAALPQATQLAIGKPLTPEEASDWSVRAAGAIRLLGLTGNKIYNINQAQTALVSILTDKRVPVSVSAANALTVIPGSQAQQAIAKLADTADGTVEVRVPAYAALAESVRRFGNLLTKAQSQAIVDVVNSKIDVTVRQAAAGALGSLNLPSDLASPLILKSGGID